MFVDFIIYGFFVFCLAKILNVTAFKRKPASRLAAWLLSIFIFILSTVALWFIKAYRFQEVSESVGVPITAENQLSLGSALAFAWLFFSFLKRQEKKQPPTQEIQP